MSWLESHQELRDHPKTARLRRRLGVSLPQAIGHLHLLWWWALDYAPTGHLAVYDADVIADAACWEDDPGVFVWALIGAGFVNDDMTIHDWDDYAGRLIEQREANARRKRRARQARRDDLLAQVARGAALPSRRTPSGPTASGARPAGAMPDTTGTSPGRPADVQGLPDLTGPDLTGPDRTTHHPTSFFPLRQEEGLRVPANVVDRLSRLPDDLTAAVFHAATEQVLTELGFACRREVVVTDRGDGKAGRLDLVAELGDLRIALELDDRTPRQKSLAKLAGVVDMARVVVLRCPADGPLPVIPGIDAVIGAGRAPAPPLAPLDPATLELWRCALDGIRSAGILNAGNLEQVCLLEPLGLDAAGALHLRAPPGLGLERFVSKIALALADAGDQAAQHVVIREG